MEREHRLVDEQDELDPREAARVRRRDHDAEAERRSLMRPGMGKVWQQITDAWGRDASRPARPPKHGARKPHPKGS